MYSSSRAKQIEKKDVAFLSAGIHDDVFLTGVRYGTSVQGRNFIEFKFVKDNRTMTHTEWEPRRTTSTGETLPDDVFYNKVDNQWERIKEILICYYKEEDLQYEEEGGFKEYAQWVIDKLSTEKLRRLLFVLKLCIVKLVIFPYRSMQSIHLSNRCLQ